MFNLIPKAYAADIGSNFYINNFTIGRFTTFSQFLQPIVNNILIISGILLFLVIAIGGVIYLFSAGNGNQEDMEKSKNALTVSILGFIIVFSAFWIIQIIEFITGMKILNSGY